MFATTLYRAALGFIIVILATLGGAGLASAAVQATPATTRAAVTQTPAAKAYTAFATWQRHPTRAHLDELVADSFKLPARYDAADIGQLYADVMGGAPRADITRDAAYVDQDLTEATLPMAS